MADMVDALLEEYTQKVVSPVTSEYESAMLKYLRINGAIEAISSLRRRIDYYSNNANSETLDQTE